MNKQSAATRLQTFSSARFRAGLRNTSTKYQHGDPESTLRS